MSSTVHRLFAGTLPSTYMYLRHQTDGIEKGLFLGCGCCLCQGVPRLSTAMAAVAHVIGSGSASSTLSRIHPQGRYFQGNLSRPILKQSVMVTFEGPSVAASAFFTVLCSESRNFLIC